MYQRGTVLHDLDEIFLSVKENFQKVISTRSYSLPKEMNSVFPNAENAIRTPLFSDAFLDISTLHHGVHS